MKTIRQTIRKSKTKTTEIREKGSSKLHAIYEPLILSTQQRKLSILSICI